MTYHLAKLQAVFNELLTSVRGLFGLDRPQLYRPEAHYMRGPGPKWIALYGDPKRAVTGARQSGDRRAF
jgi:hypothetical protein